MPAVALIDEQQHFTPSANAAATFRALKKRFSSAVHLLPTEMLLLVCKDDELHFHLLTAAMRLLL